MQKQLFFSFYLNNIQTRSLPQELQRLTEGAYFEYGIRTFHYRSKGPFTQAIFVAATRCNFGGAKVAASKSHV